LISAADTTDIPYKIQIKPIENCVNSCNSELITNSTTNETINQTSCENKCNWVFEIRGLPVDKNKVTPIKVDFKEQATIEEISTSGGWLTLSGNYIAELGNLTDITGINEKLNSLNITTTNLQKCQLTLLEYNTNLTQCNDIVGTNTNYTITECRVDKGVLENSVINKETQISTLNEEVQKQKNNKLLLIIASFIAGIIAVKWGMPFIQDKNIKKDPLSKNKQLQTEY
jgi:hypothetical protein